MKLCCKCKSAPRRLSNSYCGECYREYRRNHNNPAVEAERRRQWRISNPGAAYRVTKKWRKANPLQTREINRRRYARKRNATISPVNYDRIIERNGLFCYLCRSSIERSLPWPDPKSLTFDHVIPLVKGGSHSEKNIRVTHAVCNARKNSKVISSW